MGVTDKAISKIKAMLHSGELAPGDRLPPEQELAERFGISRSSLREAIKVLETMRVLDVKRGDGTYVTSLHPSLLLESIAFVLDFGAHERVLQILEARRLLEPQVAALAAQQITPADVTKLEAHLASIAATASTAELVAHDLELHRMIAAITGNDYLISLIEAIGSQTQRARIWRGMGENNAVQRTIDEHRQLVAAIASGDAEVAHATMLLHVSGVEKWLEHTALPQ